MSVAALIVEPENSGWYVPIATESFFMRCWIPAIQALQLQVISMFDPGVDICKDELPLLLEELDRVKMWAKIHLAEEDSGHMERRIQNLTQRLTEIFTDEGIVVFIG
ncbi:hypothetical protein [Paenibacillus sp. y28]|uniref:hypothetical protein n=1 Tax=Paenibacillus sp. y28 TaxID=3129110 RepID=UPI00301A2BFB